MRHLLAPAFTFFLALSCGTKDKSSAPGPDNASGGGSQDGGGSTGGGNGTGSGGSGSGSDGGGTGNQELRCPYEFAADANGNAVTSTLAVLAGKFETTRGMSQERGADGSTVNYKPGFTIPYNGNAVVDLKFIYEAANAREASKVEEKSRFKFTSVTVSRPSAAAGFEGYVVLLFKGLTNGPSPSLQCAVTAVKPESEQGVLARQISVLAWEYSAASASVEPKSEEEFLTPDKRPYAQRYIEH
jgi:hypothetical protein